MIKLILAMILLSTPAMAKDVKEIKIKNDGYCVDLANPIYNSRIYEFTAIKFYCCEPDKCGEDEFTVFRSKSLERKYNEQLAKQKQE